MFLLFLLFPLSFSESTALTVETFEEFIKSNSRVLIEFYAPWCGHCKRLQPEYEAAAKFLKEDPNSKTKLGKVDAVKHKEIAERFGVRGYPTLKYFINGDLETPVDYNGGRTKDKILSWVQTQELPAVSFIKSEEDLNGLRSKKSIVLVVFLEKADPDAMLEIEKAAEKLRNDLVVAVAYGSELTGESELPTVAFYMEDFEPLYFPGPITESSILRIFRNERFPPIGEIGPDNYQSYMDRNLPLVWLAISPDEEKTANAVLDVMEPFAIERKGKLSFVWLDADKFSGHIENLGIQKIPGFLLIDEETNEKFKFSGDIMNTEDLTDFFTKYDEGKLESFLKSESEPEQNEGNVKVLVGSSFARMAFNKEHDVFVEFYAPWCGHCKKLAPEWDKLGDAFSAKKDVVIAKLDATENDTPEEVEGFPTLVLYPKDCDSISCGVPYKGSRVLNELISWVSKQTATTEGTATDTDKDEL